MSVQWLCTSFGIGLIVLGAILFAVARQKTSSTIASQGSVAVGNNNNGQIINVNQQRLSPANSEGYTLKIIAMVVEVAGIAMTLWSGIHLVAK